MTSHSQHSGFSFDKFPYEIIGKKAVVTMVIGDVGRWNAAGRDVPLLEGFTFLEFEQITPKALFEIRPEVVLSPLVADNFDATQVAARLLSCSFQGRYRAVTDSLPDAQMVVREIRRGAPGIDFDLIVWPESATPEAVKK